MFLDYPLNKKAYKIYSLVTHQISYSRDVLFYETIFPFQSNYDSSTHFVPVFPSNSSSYFSDSDQFVSHSTSFANDSSSGVTHVVDPSHDQSSTAHDSTTLDSSVSLDPTSSFQESPPIPRPQRTRIVPLKFQDYTGLPSQFQSAAVYTTPYPMTKYLSYEHVTPSYKAFSCQISSQTEPKTYAQAIRNPLWYQAMANELQALEENNTWTV